MEKYITPEMISVIFTVVVLPLLTVLTKSAVKYINSKTENDTIKKYIEIAEDAVSTAVQSVGQTYVDSLKESGSFTEEAQQEAFNKARKTAIELMGETAKNVLTETYGDVNSWIDNKIESYVSKFKN